VVKEEVTMKLSVLIATTVDRREMFGKLMEEFATQATDEVQILFEEDDKKMSIGRKRQLLLERAEGDYIVYFDSDDFPYPNYLSEILTALDSGPDCVGFLIHMTTNGKHPQVCCHSLRFKAWAKHVHGYDYVRGVTHFNPVRRELALKIGFPDLRFGEDKIYSDRITRICRKEVFINKKLFHYRYTNAVPHRQKYGIK
jgi:glycosyltransferase involved in cell wall biosynthesis